MSDPLPALLARAQEYLKELPPAPQKQETPLGPALAGWIDYTLLKPAATAEQVKRLCDEARQYRFATVCVNPSYVPLASGVLHGSEVGVCGVVSFPFGAHLPNQKVAEAESVMDAGATEIDMVLNIGALKGQAYPMVEIEIESVVEAAHKRGILVKVCIETALLTREEKIIACLLSESAGADFVKTSTGFGPGGTTQEDVDLMRRVLGPNVGVKASGNIRTLANTRDMIANGASRIGTSAGVTILEEALQGEQA